MSFVEIALLVSLLINAGLSAAAFVLWTDRSRMLHELNVATDRLFAAWKEGFKIPQAYEVLPPDLEDEEPLEPDLVKAIEAWESPEAQASQKRWIKSMIELGHPQKAIVKMLEVR
jgi:hypothetical protein